MTDEERLKLADKLEAEALRRLRARGAIPPAPVLDYGNDEPPQPRAWFPLFSLVSMFFMISGVLALIGRKDSPSVLAAIIEGMKYTAMLYLLVLAAVVIREVGGSLISRWRRRDQP